MNKLDRRFLKGTGLSVTEWNNVPPENPVAGDRIIISSTPATTSAFKGRAVNDLAYYDGTRWIFSTPEVNDVVIQGVDIYVFDGTDWVHQEGSVPFAIPNYTSSQPVIIFDAGMGETLPETCTTGQKFLLLKQKIDSYLYAAKMHVAIAPNIWDKGVSIRDYSSKYGTTYIVVKTDSGVKEYRLAYTQRKDSSTGNVNACVYDLSTVEAADCDYVNSYVILHERLTDDFWMVDRDDNLIRLGNKNEFTAIRPIDGIVFTTKTTEEAVVSNAGEKWLSIETNKLYTTYESSGEIKVYTGASGELAPVSIQVGNRYVSQNTACIFTRIEVDKTLIPRSGSESNANEADAYPKYYYNVEQLKPGEIFFNKEDQLYYVYDAVNNKFKVVNESVTSGITSRIDDLENYYNDEISSINDNIDSLGSASLILTTETHTLTAAEIASKTKSFNLANTVATGEESSGVCFLNGLAQAIDVAFTLSGNTFSWDGKTLDGQLADGDVIIVQYLRAI